MGVLDGRVAIVTGAGRGIGQATAKLFASEGARVIVATRSAQPGRDTVDAITAAGGEARLVALDVGDRASVSDLVRKTMDHFGQLDVIVHNAAHVAHGALGKLPEAELDKTFDVGLKAAFWLTADALPHLEASKAARILLTSSFAGNRQSVVNMVHYCSMKAGVNGFIRAAALELARKGITVNGVEPGLTLGHHLQTAATPEAIKALSAMIPIERPAQPIEIAHAFLYLASEQAQYVTGTTILVDGGASLGRPAALELDKL